MEKIKCISCNKDERLCRCSKCVKCGVKMGDKFTYQEKLNGECTGCDAYYKKKYKFDERGLGSLIFAIYDRAVQDVVSGSIQEKDFALRWINSESFYIYPKVLALKLEGLREGILETIEREKKRKKS